MSSDYIPIDEFPDLNGNGGTGPLTMQDDGDELLYEQTFRADYEIDSTSNTTPIVVTTTSPHTFTTGDVVQILGSGDVHAEGRHVVTVLSSTTFSLDASVADGGAPALLPPGRVYDPHRGLLAKLIDASAYMYKRLFGTAYTTGVVSIQGRKVLRRPRPLLTDAAHTIAVSDGDRFELRDPAAPRIITLGHSTTAPREGETLDFVCPEMSGGGTQYTFQRETAVIVAKFVGATVAPSNPCYHAEFEYTGGVWRLGANSGSSYDGGSPAVYGVVPGAGA